MGFESFGVELRDGRATALTADEAIGHLPGAEKDPGAIPGPGSTFYTVRDGSHVIEAEVVPEPTRISLRFTLCHPESVDAAFLGIVGGLAKRLRMTMWIADDVSPDRAGPYEPQQFEEFAEVASRCIASRRREWTRQFGDERWAATTPEAFERFILPHCVPVGG